MGGVKERAARERERGKRKRETVRKSERVREKDRISFRVQKVLRE